MHSLHRITSSFSLVADIRVIANDNSATLEFDRKLLLSNTSQIEFDINKNQTCRRFSTLSVPIFNSSHYLTGIQSLKKANNFHFVFSSILDHGTTPPWGQKVNTYTSRPTNAKFSMENCNLESAHAHVPTYLKRGGRNLIER